MYGVKGLPMEGVVFYQDFPSDRYSMSALCDLALRLGARSVKTWIKGKYKGEIPLKAGNKDYEKIFSSFDIVKLNVCPEYSKEDVTEDFHLLTEELKGFNTNFIVNYFFEMNHYFTPEEAVRFIRKAQKGLRGVKASNVHDCIEVAVDGYTFAQRVWRGVQTDFHSVTCYYLPVCVAYRLFKRLSPSPLLLGEHGHKARGPPLGEGLQDLQLRSDLSQIHRLKIPHSWYFWLADQESKVEAEGRWGLIDLEGHRRKSYWTMKKHLMGRRK